MAESFEHRPTRLIRRHEGEILARQNVRLSVKSGKHSGSERVCAGERVRIGAGPGNDLVLSDPEISSAHCEISIAADGFHVRDLGSLNGVRVGGVRVLEAILAPDCIIKLGDISLRFQTLSEVSETPLHAQSGLGAAVGQSAAMREIFAKIERVARSEATVLISGETGSGKEVVAGAIWELSPRAAQPLVVVDCGAMASTLVESELFGHERGAFTGAVQRRVGAFERAHGGTLFLDEVGELELGLQPKLLRALEQREIQRVGGEKTLPVDVRILAATHRDLRAMVARGQFREDLYYRLAVVHLHVPPLRDRREDIPVLVDHLLEQLGKSRHDLAPGSVERFCEAPWPGNVRELKNALERALVLGDLAHLPADHAAGALAAPARHEPVDTALPFKDAKAALIERFERAYVQALLKAHAGNVSAAARQAQIDRMSLHKLMNKYALERERSPAADAAAPPSPRVG